MRALRGYTVDWPHSLTALSTCTESTSAPPTLNGTLELSPLPLDFEKHAFLEYRIYMYIFDKTVVVGWWKKYYKTWCCEWRVWPVHSLIMAIGVTYKAIRLMVSLVLEEVTLKSWRGINFENTAKEYKRWSEISPGELQGERELQLWLGFRDGLGLDDPFDFLWYWHCTCNKMVRRKNKKN